jgi:tetratricopeptide (TPR) repeat protein
MPAPPLKQVEDAAHQLVEALPGHDVGPASLWQVDGVATAGKSSCLRMMATLLEQQGKLKPILVAPPMRNLDTGPSALADVAVGLAGHGLLNGDLGAWTEGGASWSERLDLISSCIARHDDVVLLCDEPRSWGANRGTDDFFARRSFDASLFICGLPCRRVVTGQLPVPGKPVDITELRPAATDPSWLRDGWGVLQDAANEVAESSLLGEPLTALEIRLVVAATSLTSLSTVSEWIVSDRSPRAIASQFATLIAENKRHRRLWDAWLRLSLTRRAFDPSMLSEIALSGLSDLERDIVLNCLLFGEQQLRLHDLLRGQAAKWRAENRAKSAMKKLLAATNRKLFKLHQQRFDAFVTDGDARALIESMEAFHFASATGDMDLIASAKPTFVEQLDALGWSLSYEHRKYAEAVKAFEQALVWDDEDDYAHHYLAYNLDRLGERAEEIEGHFRRAIGLNGDHPWWRARLVTFLISRGRVTEAMHAWEDALLALGVDEDDASPQPYESLHIWVAGALLQAGEPRLSREVLDAIPPWVHPQLELYATLDQRTDALLEIGEGGPVVPAWRLRPRWWQDGPERLQYRLGGDERLVRWLAARVESKDQSGINIRAAVLEQGQKEEPVIAWSEIDLDSFDVMCRDDVSAKELRAGTFLEVGVYALPGKQAKHAETIIRVLPSRVWAAPGPSELPVLRHVEALAIPRNARL